MEKYDVQIFFIAEELKMLIFSSNDEDGRYLISLHCGQFDEGMDYYSTFDFEVAEFLKNSEQIVYDFKQAEKLIEIVSWMKRLPSTVEYMSL